jgi:Transcriptional Coactivator p15 (PC4)
MTRITSRPLTSGSSGDDACFVIRKNAEEEVRVVLSTFKGHRLVDIRIYADFGQGERKPTKKGICLKVEKLADLIHALENVANHVVGR